MPVFQRSDGITVHRQAIRWDTREEWAKRRRTVYYGMDRPDRFITPYEHLVTPAMKAAARAELDALWKALGPHARTAQRPAADKLYRAKQITYADAVARCETPGDTARDCRHEIREDQKSGCIRAPLGYGRCMEDLPTVFAAHPLAAVHAYVAASDERAARANADWLAEVAQTPIDDEAWAQELARRADWDEGR
jgi:hypothetical protein